jgi:hypothetical protein
MSNWRCGTSDIIAKELNLDELAEVSNILREAGLSDTEIVQHLDYRRIMEGY